MFILDTNVISELRHGKPNQSPSVRAWAATQPIGQLFLSAITILELEKGIQALERRRTPQQGGALRVWLAGISIAFAGRILPFTEHTAPVCAALHVPNVHAERDAMIAATAIEHGFTVVTRNVPDFINTGAPLINPWLHLTEG
ncbi:putative nucleic acid-binding protein, contains PIN domain [Candidatus Regiella insecticola 5.15]|uniref:Ribonuclease VapC n=1 Tax=Candidatus Regiella insecticola 5.15 TaxID=1005043 RepID=G2GXC8_9ENTR|nr:type II toxin-antitoxin system VapC family toxin [Candidatus Regiella insecticola]EGY29602.1 putative nucleic acid-binding protein, contains PIN domain [Candidatus Regiella insecticola 5.15]